MLVNWFLYKNGLYSQPTYYAFYSLGYKGNHCNNKDLLGMKQRRTATGFLHTPTIQGQSAIFKIILESHELYMAVHAIEWGISQCFAQPDRTYWDTIFKKYAKGLCDFCTYFREVYIHGVF